MKKIAYLEAINERLPKKMDLRMIGVFVGRAYNQVLHEVYRKNPSGMELFTKVYNNVAIQHDSDRDVYYSTLPVVVVKLPNVGDGVRSIHSMKGKAVEFIPIRSEMLAIHQDLEVNNLNGPIPYYVLGGRVEYQTMGGIEQVEVVRMHIVPEFDALDMLDDFYIPGGYDERIVEMTINLIQGTPPEKEVNDQNTKTA